VYIQRRAGSPHAATVIPFGGRLLDSAKCVPALLFRPSQNLF
jgi:hypothetical protein